MPLFPRRVEVQLAGAGEALNIGDLMVRWELERTADSRGPTGQVSLYNLAARTESRLKDRFTELRLWAGYPDRFGLLVDGQIGHVRRERQGLDRVAHAEVKGRIRETRGRNVMVDLTYMGEVPLAVVVVAAARHMGLAIESVRHVTSLGIVLEDYSTGLVPAYQLLDHLLLPHGVRWYEDMGVVRFARDGVPGASRSAIPIISERSGMIGTPGILDDGIRVRTLTDHRIQLDGVVVVRSAFYREEIRGIWKVVSIRDWGDSWDGDAVTEFDARPM